MANLGYLFYKHYWLDEEEDLFKNAKAGVEKTKNGLNDKNTKILNTTYKEIKKSQKIHDKLVTDYYLDFRTIYPGLLIGTGYEQGIGTKEEFSAGFLFDYTTGLPYLPGSSIKGMLRSFFPTKIKENEKEDIKIKTEKINVTKVKILNDLIKKDFDKQQWYDIAEQIFEGNELPMSKRDTFIIGEIYEAGDQKILKQDHITPHITQNQDLLKNPIPLKLIKIPENIKIRCYFNLHNIKGSLLTAEEKLQLFMEILLISGMGAKTNVGYGQFDETFTTESYKKRKKYFEKRDKEREEQEKNRIKKQKEEEQKRYMESLSPVNLAIYKIEKKIGNYVSDILNNIHELDESDQKQIAEALKEDFISRKKWKQNPKRLGKYPKIQKIKQILGEI